MTHSYFRNISVFLVFVFISCIIKSQAGVSGDEVNEDSVSANSNYKPIYLPFYSIDLAIQFGMTKENVIQNLDTIPYEEYKNYLIYKLYLSYDNQRILSRLIFVFSDNRLVEVNIHRDFVEHVLYTYVYNFLYGMMANNFSPPTNLIIWQNRDHDILPADAFTEIVKKSYLYQYYWDVGDLTYIMICRNQEDDLIEFTIKIEPYDKTRFPDGANKTDSIKRIIFLNEDKLIE